MNKHNEYTNIKKTLDRNREMYYNTGESTMTDYEYDLLIEKLKTLEKELGIIENDSPTITVGAKAHNGLAKIIHEHPMLSLDKCHSVEEIIKIAKGKETLAMLKMDGLTISATYDNGKLIRLETRGDGNEGNDVMLHATSFQNLPLTIDKPGRYVVDGEAIISYADFQKINSKLSEKDKYRNPRNLAAGTLNLLDPKESAKRHLQFIVWDVIEGGDNNRLSDNLIEARNKYGFSVTPASLNWAEEAYASYTTTSIKNTLTDLKDRAHELDYPIDGIVIKFNDIEYGKSLGLTSHHFNNAIAYKFEDELYETVIQKIEWTMGKTGVLTPVAVFEPVEIDGTFVERASVHNVSIYNELELVSGDHVLVYKANMIIPQIAKNLSAERRAIEKDYAYQSYPGTCPICGALTEITQSNDTKVLICTNTNCKGKLLGKLKTFVSKSGMNIDGLSEATLEKFINKGWLVNFSDIYSLDAYAKEMQKMEGFGIKSINKLLANIAESKNVTMERFLCALSIPGIGRSQSKMIAKQFNHDWFKFEKAIIEGYNFASIEGIGSILNTNIHAWYANEFVENRIDKLTVLVKFLKPKQNSDVDSSLQGLVFVITGSLNHFANRDELKRKLEEKGAKVAGSISKKTNYLINNDSESASSKNKKAKELGVAIITEEELINRYLK